MTSICLLSPNLDTSKLVDARAILPAEIELHGHGFRVPRYTDAVFARTEAEVLKSLDRVADKKHDFIMVTGELFFAHIGHQREKELIKKVSAATGTPASTVVEAVRNAFSALSLHRIAVATPFSKAQSDFLADYLVDEGMEVVARTNLGYEDSASVWKLAPETGYQAAAQLLHDHPEAEGIYFPNNQWRITSVIDRIEKEFGKPVIANTPAWIREALTKTGKMRPISGYGKLLAL